MTTPLGFELEVPLPPGWLTVDLVQDDWEQEVRSAVAEVGGLPEDHLPALDRWIAELRTAEAQDVLSASLLVEQDEPGADARTATLTLALGPGPLLPLPSEAEVAAAAAHEQAPPFGQATAVEVPAGRGWVVRDLEPVALAGVGELPLSSTTVLLELTDDHHLVLTGTTWCEALRDDVEKVVVTVAHLVRVGEAEQAGGPQ